MRVIAGAWKGRHIAAPTGRDTRPTADRVREAIFSAVYSAMGTIEGAVVADLYAGSGALGIEALSRGAASCVFVEIDRRAVSVIQRNLDDLGVAPGDARILHADVGRIGALAEAMGPVSLLLADPPYRIDAAAFRQVMEALTKRGALEEGALVVYEHAAESAAEWPSGFDAGPTRRYGDTAVSLATYEG
jgi:16S rRNA (guanine966-N2)-methyltransferase